MYTVLFVGGPADRIVKNLYEAVEIFIFPSKQHVNTGAIPPEHPVKTEIKGHQYRRTAIDDSDGLVVYRHNSLTVGESLSRLMHAYAGNHDDNKEE